MQVYTVNICGNRFEPVYDFVLFGQIVDAAFLFGCEISVAHLAEGGEQIFETHFFRVGSAYKGVAGLGFFGEFHCLGFQFGVAEQVESLLDSGHFLMPVSFLGLDYCRQGIGQFTLCHLEILVAVGLFLGAGVGSQECRGGFCVFGCRSFSGNILCGFCLSRRNGSLGGILVLDIPFSRDCLFKLVHVFEIE